MAGEWIKESLGLTSWEAATDLVRRWESAGAIGQQRREIPSIADAITKFLDDAESRELRQTSIRKYRQFLERQLLPFAEATGKTRLHQLDVEALRAFRSSWKFKASTQQKKLETMRGIFRFCASAGWIPSNPASAVKLPKVHQVPTLPFAPDEFNELLDECDRFRGNGQRLRALLLLLRHSGLRIGNAVALRRDRVFGISPIEMVAGELPRTQRRLQLGVARTIHFAHPAHAEQTENLVRTETASNG